MNDFIYVALLLFSVFTGSFVAIIMKRHGIKSSDFKKGFTFLFEFIILILVFLIGVESSSKFGSKEFIQGLFAVALGIVSALASSLFLELITRLVRK